MKKALSIVLSLVMILSTLTALPFAANADDDLRIQISEITATSNIADVAVYGKPITAPGFTVTTGKPAYFNTTMAAWQKKDGAKWVRVETGAFSEGIYRYIVQIRVDASHTYEGANGTTHRLANVVNVTIDGTPWTDTGGNTDISLAGSGTDYTFLPVTGPEINIEKVVVPFSFTGSYTIEKSYVNNAITPVSVAGGAVGGEEPYTFSKVSGPEWLTVSPDGTISGTPTAAGANSALVVKATDSLGAEGTINVTVSNTVPDPALREKITEIEATSNAGELAEFGKPITQPTFTVTKGKPVYFNYSTGHWYKKDGETWTRVDDGTFSDGVYRYAIQVRTDTSYSYDGANGTTHILADPFTVKVDDVFWKDSATGEETITGAIVGTDYSWISVTSPEIAIHNYATVTVTAPTCTEKGYTTHTCTECGDSYADTYVDALGHTEIADEAIAPTCSTAGKTAGTHCSVCGEILVAQSDVDALGHKWDEGKITKAASYTAAGVMTYTCTVCGETRTEEIAQLAKKANTMLAKGKTAKVKLKSLKKKNQTVAQKNAFTVTKAQGKVTYAKASGNKKITVDKNGKITVKKGLKKGTYKVKVKVKAAGNKEYKAAVKTVTVTIKVK